MDAIQLIIIGNVHVGKSTLISRYTGAEAEGSSQNTSQAEVVQPTISLDVKNTHFQYLYDGEMAQWLPLRLWDTAGQEKYCSITKSIFRKANGAILVYDISDRQSFLDIEEVWI